jgi:hypothetical protein
MTMNNLPRKWAVFVLCDALGFTRVDRWLMAYDLEANNGHGEFVFTHNMVDAMSWESPDAIFKSFAEAPKNHPVRSDDGQPNRPLRMWTVQFVELPATIVEQQLVRQKGN